MMTQGNPSAYAVTLVALLALALLQGLANLKKPDRVKQMLLPVIALVYSAAAICLLYYYRDWVSDICKMVSFLTDGSILIMNAGLMGLFIIIKFIIRLALKKKAPPERDSGGLQTRFYFYDDGLGRWFLQERWVDFRKIVTALRVCAYIVCVVMLGMAWANGPEAGTWLMAFPCAALLFLNEAGFCLEGQTQEEFQHSVSGEESTSTKIGNYYRIREIYEKLFAPQVLAAHTRFELSNHEGFNAVLKKMAASKDTVDRHTARFFQTYGEKVAFNTDCIQATLKMMHGKSVVFNDPFYRDLEAYLTLPILNALLKGEKCLVITGRSSTGRDAQEWLTDLLRKYSHLRSFWRVSPLGIGKPDCEVGVLSFRQIYDPDVLTANKQFFSESGFVLLLEPSVMVNTGQIGISIVAEETRKNGELPVYCICDRYTSGLVDAMSHLLRTEITNVMATPAPRCIYTGMAWNADGDFIRQKLFEKQTRYLGNGVELAAVAVRNQIPLVTWYGETKAPLRDIRWIAGQYFSSLCRYMNIPTQQKSLYERISFVPSLWSSGPSKEQFAIVEDEFCNMFTMMRAYLSRGDSHTFVNILSENYLLRDYMRCNQQMFISNPNAIPSIVPDYAKTVRNTLLKMIIQMAFTSVSETEMKKELMLAGITGGDVFQEFSKLLKEYTFTDGSIVDIRSKTDYTDLLAAHTENYYSISKGVFEDHFSKTLKNAYYIVEDEKQEEAYIDAKLFGHVGQTILPGQFVTYDGKYYQAKLVSPETGVILRRAADLYSDRRYYRQIRKYTFQPCADGAAVYARKISDIRLRIVSRDFCVETSGYLDLHDGCDLRSAKAVSFEGDPASGNFNRRYRRKNVLEIEFPETDDKIRFTICVLMSEVFHSLFPDAWQYLAVVSKQPEDTEGMLNYMVNGVEGDIEDDLVYVVEDSDIDLGLLDAVNRSFQQILEIIADFIDWHNAKMREPESKDPVPGKVTLPPDQQVRKRSMLDRIRKIFGGKEKEVDIVAPPEKNGGEEAPESGAADQQPAGKEPEGAASGSSEYALDSDGGEAEGEKRAPALPEDERVHDSGDFSLEDDEQAEQKPEQAEQKPEQAEQKPEQAKLKSDDAAKQLSDHPEDEIQPEEQGNADIVNIDGTDIFEAEGMPDDSLWFEDMFRAAGIADIPKTRYQTECYLKFGYDEIDKRLRIEEVLKYLHVRGYCNSALALSRKRDAFDESESDLETDNHCDFCGMPLNGACYELLNDGRVRCNECSATAITKLEDFKELFYKVLELMNAFYKVTYRFPISVRTTNAAEVAKGAGCVFRPSKDVAPRVLGYAQCGGGHYAMVIENGSPMLAAMDTMSHELTHVWQRTHWNEKDIVARYGGGRNREIVYEGMACWASIQFLYQMGETAYAQRQELETAARQDVYGVGFNLYRAKYPLVKDMSLIKFSPFATYPPL